MRLMLSGRRYAGQSCFLPTRGNLHSLHGTLGSTRIAKKEDELAMLEEKRHEEEKKRKRKEKEKRANY